MEFSPREIIKKAEIYSNSPMLYFAFIVVLNCVETKFAFALVLLLLRSYDWLAKFAPFSQPMGSQTN